MGTKSEGLEVPIGVTMRHPRIADVPPIPDLPAPLVTRPARIDEAGELADLLGRAYPDEIWEELGTELELFRDDTVKGTLVVASEGRLLATASLQVRPESLECGWVRWVATEESQRRQGLARVLVTSVLSMAVRAGCREARLKTETDRLAAISLYLQLGFEPVVTTDREREIWNQLRTRAARGDD